MNTKKKYQLAGILCMIISMLIIFASCMIISFNHKEFIDLPGFFINAGGLFTLGILFICGYRL